MFKHCFVNALRHFLRHKTATTINLMCLIIGLTGFVGAYLTATFLDSADKYFPNSDRIFAITQTAMIPGSGVPAGTLPYAAWMTAKYLRSDFPQLPVARATLPEKIPIAAGDIKLSLQATYADAEFFNIFALSFIAGDRNSALRQPHSVVLTEDAAKRLFGGAEAVLGRRLVISNSVDVEVAGVVSNIRRPSHMQSGSVNGFDMLVSMDVFEQSAAKKRARENWTAITVSTYVMLPVSGALTPDTLQTELAAFGKRNVPADRCICGFTAVPIYELALTTMNGVVGTDRTGISARSLLYILGGLLLFISCMNYANLATAQAAARAKEVGMRRIVGASRLRVMVQFFFEAALLSSLALLAVIAVVGIGLAMSTAPESAFVLQRVLASSQSWAGAALLLGVTTLTAGAYPALFLSRVKPIEAVRAGQARTPPRSLSRVLIGVQFASASFLLIAVLVMSVQNASMKRSALGGESDPIVVLKNNVRVAAVSMDALRTELLRQPHVKSVTAYPVVPWSLFVGLLRISKSPEDAASARLVSPNRVGQDFFQTLEMKLLAGRVFDGEHADDVSVWKEARPANVVIDRALAEQQGWFDLQQAVGKTLFLRGAVIDREVLPRPLKVIGVVEGKSLGVMGMGATSNVYFLQPADAVFPIVKIATSNVQAALAEIDAVWNTLAPSVAIERQFSGELLSATYATFGRVAAAFAAISVLAFISAVLGLVGMSIYVVGRRTREIGIRKTLGATGASIFALLIIDFSKPVIIANLIAWPLAFGAMRMYLRLFTDRSALSLAPFLLSAMIALLIAWIAVTAQVIRAARVRPAEVLRYE